MALRDVVEAAEAYVQGVLHSKTWARLSVSACGQVSEQLSNNRLHLTALSAPPGQAWRRRFVLADARTAPQVKRVFCGPAVPGDGSRIGP